MRLIKLAIPLAILFVVGLVAWKLINPNKGTLELHTSPDSAVVQLDGRTITTSSLKLSPANYTVVVAADGYISQLKTVTITKGKTSNLTVDLAKKTTSNLVETIYRDTVYKAYPNYQLTVLGSRELDGGAWIVGGVQGGEDPVMVVLKRDSSADGYSFFLAGPPFDSSLLTQLPADVQALIRDDTWLGIR